MKKRDVALHFIWILFKASISYGNCFLLYKTVVVVLGSVQTGPFLFGFRGPEVLVHSTPNKVGRDD